MVVNYQQEVVELTHVAGIFDYHPYMTFSERLAKALTVPLFVLGECVPSGSGSGLLSALARRQSVRAGILLL